MLVPLGSPYTSLPQTSTAIHVYAVSVVEWSITAPPHHALSCQIPTCNPLGWMNLKVKIGAKRQINALSLELVCGRQAGLPNIYILSSSMTALTSSSPWGIEAPTLLRDAWMHVVLSSVFDLRTRDLLAGTFCPACQRITRQWFRDVSRSPTSACRGMIQPGAAPRTTGCGWHGGRDQGRCQA